MDSERKKILLEKFFNDQCSAQELDELLNSYLDYTNVDEDNKIIGEEMERVFEKLKIERRLSSSKSESIFNSIILKEREEEIYSAPTNRNTWIYRVAASFAGLLLASSLIYILFFTNNEVIYKTAYGETMEVSLPDGSKVVLNSNSSLSYSKDWNNNLDRTVKLVGEAFFQVTHKANNQKFIVETSQLNVEVLGTEFNVLSRKERSQVVLNSGKVRLNINRSDTLSMRPGEVVEIGTGEKPFKKLSVNPDIYSSWKDNVITFHGTTLSEIAVMLEENYGKKVLIKDKSLANEKFSGTFPVNEDINLLIKMLSKAFHCKTVEKNGYLIFEN